MPQLNPANDPDNTEKSDDDLIRLREYVDTLAQLIEYHDNTPARWRHYQTEWLWLYARGMVAGESPGDVKARRLAELESQKSRGSSAYSRRAYYVKIEMYGGPADGQFRYAEWPAEDQVTVTATTFAGRKTKVVYRQQPETSGDIVAVPITGEVITDSVMVSHAFAEKRPVRYVYVPRRKRKANS